MMLTSFELRTYRGVSSHTAKNYYRPDLRAESVARASAIRKSQRPVKKTPEKKLRGGKAKKAEEAKAT
jgi:large subunit ribosomal protein L28e